MKMISSIPNPFFFAGLIVIAAIACKKPEIVTVTVQQPAAEFSVYITDPSAAYPRDGNANYIDSNFYFRNLSDTSANIKYRWDFGDGSISTEKTPKHSYSKRGSYNVKLTVSNDNKASGSVQHTVSVILGQKRISLGDNIDLDPVAIEETTTNEFVLLGSEGNGTIYHLFQLDSLLKQKSEKAFPSSYRLTSMKATADGNYIFTGTTHSARQNNELIKMNAAGTELWKKLLANDDTYTHAAPTPDGGYVVVGARPVTPGYYYTVVIKTDGNGNIQWQKFLDGEGMINTNNAVVEQDGIVVSGTKRGNWAEMDSIFIVKLNNVGNVVWKKTVLGGMNNFIWWNTSIAKLTNGNYALTNGNTTGIFYFSHTGEFLDRKLAPHQVAAVLSSADGNLIALLSEQVNGNSINVSKLMLDGVQKWYGYPEGRSAPLGSYSCCSSSWPVAIRPLRNGGTIVAGYLVDNSGIYGSQNLTLLFELDDAGIPK